VSTTELALAVLIALAAQDKPAPSVDEIRTETRGLLQTMCGDQCDVIDVKIRQKRVAPPGSGAPGFDDAPQSKTVPGDVELTLLFDQKLTKPYRDFVADRVKQRVAELGLPVLIQQQVRSFPAPPPPPIEPLPPLPQYPPPQPVIVQPPPPPPPPAPEIAKPAQPDLQQALLLRLIEALPLLLLFGLLAWMVMRVMKRMENLAMGRPLQNEDDEVLTPEIVEESRPPSTKAMTIPPPRTDELAGDLNRYRGSTRRIFRRLLMAGEYDTVARSVALLGDFVVQDLSHDPMVRRALGAAGQRTSEILRNPITEDEKEELLRTVHAELVADRVAHRSDDVRDELEALLSWGPEAFAAMMSKLDRRLGVVLLRHAPGHLTESYLKGLSPSERAKRVREVLEAPAAEPEELDVLAESIESQAQSALVGGYEADHIVDLLDALPADEQDALVSNLESTRPDYVRRNLGQLPVESSLLRVPEPALGSAWVVVPVEDWIAYLRVAPEAIRIRALAACPARLRDGVENELSLRVAADPDRATRARRRIIQAALQAAPDVVQQRKQVPAKSSASKEG
jgi:hypothetical protein